MIEATGRKSDPEFDLWSTDDREMELLIHCARTTIEADRAARIRALASEGVIWDRLLKLAQRNGLSPLLYFHLNRICADSVPKETLEPLRDYFQKNTAFSLLLTGELVRLLKSFEEHDIKAVPYKGPAMAAKLYGNPALRQFCDLDVLVREKDVWTASEAIVAEGFEPHFDIPENKRAAFVRLSYVQLFRRDAGRTLIELHWGIAPRFFGVQFDGTEVWRRLETMSLQGATIPMLSGEDLLLMLCVHGAKDCWEKLEWVCAIAELLRSTQKLDWDRVFQQARQMRCHRMLLLGLLLVHGLFHLPLPVQASSIRLSPRLLLLAKEVTQSFSSSNVTSPTFRQRVSFHLRLKDGFADQARHCVRLATTTTPVDWSTMRLPRSLSFVYPFLRVVRLTRKYGVNNRPQFEPPK